MLNKSGFVLIGKIAMAHGIKGLVKIQSFTKNPGDFVIYGPIFDDNQNELKIKIDRVLQNGIVLSQIENVSDRTAAEKLRGLNLYVKRDKLPETDNTDSFYAHDLIGLNVFDEDNNDLGSVISVQNYGAGDILEIGAKENSKLVLFHNNFVKSIDLQNKKIVIYNV